MQTLTQPENTHIFIDFIFREITSIGVWWNRIGSLFHEYKTQPKVIRLEINTYIKI